MKIEFYDLKAKKKFETDVVEKKTFEKNGKFRYMVVGKTSDDRKCTKFVNKETFDKC